MGRSSAADWRYRARPEPIGSRTGIRVALELTCDCFLGVFAYLVAYLVEVPKLC